MTMSLLIDLPMINEAGEYQLKIKPFVGFPGAIFRPHVFSKNMNSLSESLDRSLLSVDRPSIFDSPENISKGITQADRKIPSLPIDFDQEALPLYCRPSTIYITIKENNQLLDITMQRTPYSKVVMFRESIKIEVFLQVCE